MTGWIFKQPLPDKWVEKRFDFVLLTLPPCSAQVYEGHMIELDSSIISADDRDVPKDPLLFSVARKPQHGLLVNAARSKDSHYIKQLAHEIHNFSTDLLKNGRSRSTSASLLLLM